MEDYNLDTYKTLKVSPLNPPEWVFGPVWSILYVMIAISGWLYFSGKSTTRGAWLFGGQLLLNGLWPYVFFRLNEYCLATGIIFSMIVLVALTIAEFWKRNKVAAYLLMPYLAWITFASYLNTYVCLEN
jgi:tryptophan-rich sensory protein